MNRLVLVTCLLLGAMAAPASAGIFSSGDPLAPRDQWGLLHQSPSTNPTDFERRRYHTRFTYNMQSGRKLANDPAYVGALQVALRRTGYYCGSIDGVFSPEVIDAITRLQKNHSMRVTGNLSPAVRRALHLP